MTDDLETRVVLTMAALNGPQGDNDDPYPWCLRPIARAVIDLIAAEGEKL